METRICPGCGDRLECGRAAGKDRCWCADLPRIMPVPDVGTGCYCPTCLEREIRCKQERETP